MISKVLSIIGIAFVASLLLVGCDEAAEEASKSEPAMKEESKSAASGSSKDEVKMGSSMKDVSEMTEEERKQAELVEKLHKATHCGGFDQTCTQAADTNLYAIKDEKAEKAGTATTTRTNDGRQPGGGLWSKLKKKE